MTSEIWSGNVPSWICVRASVQQQLLWPVVAGQWSCTVVLQSQQDVAGKPVSKPFWSSFAGFLSLKLTMMGSQIAVQAAGGSIPAHDGHIYTGCFHGSNTENNVLRIECWVVKVHQGWNHLACHDLCILVYEIYGFLHMSDMWCRLKPPKPESVFKCICSVASRNRVNRSEGHWGAITCGKWN